MFRVERRSVLRRQSAGRRRRHERAERRAPVLAARRGRRRSITRRCSAPNLLNEARFAYLNGDPVTLWEAQDALDHLHARRLGAVHDRPVARRPTSSATRRSSRTRCRGRAASTTSASAAASIHHTSGGTGSEPGTAILGTFTFLNTTTAPFDQLTLADVQKYTQPINFGISSYELTQWLYTAFVQDSIHVQRRPHARPRAALRPADADRRDEELRAARRLRLASGRRFARWRFAAATACTTRRFAPTRSPATLVNGLDGLTTYTATPGQLGFPTCLTGSCLPLSFDPRTLPASQLPARDITIRAGQRDFYERSSRSTG